ncbi:peptidoglycan-binding protein LysM [Cognatishimia activa]|uniref:LysM domain/BON superfamily protein n=1 Tax=Cognatishimia activa TaxID=1715691 RepID=A0A0N7MB65_9RHOB|nr:peptidoglycan-binding protein LysM [Cognatishimia activa]CUI40199.1 LysM domain/BON superfamily protein [Cognatishimia activa]CUK24544.1 LysM domain/BON superfamily protein [Cognatishimia activa]
MGLFDFFRGGKKVSAAAPTATDLKKEVADLGLAADNVEIEVDGDIVKVSGNVDQETKEKVILAVGNVEGISKVEDNLGGADPKFHTVEKGDSLWKVAEKALGNGARYTEIFEANKPMLTDPDKIYPGQVLRIPG